MKTTGKWKRIVLKRYDRLIKLLFALLIGLSVTACDEPEDPMPEYGVIPMYGVPASVINE